METSHSPGRVTAAALTLALVTALLAIQVTTAPPAAAAAVSVSPLVGQPGTAVTVEGSAFQPLTTVDLCWAADGCSDLGSVSADESGAFVAQVTIPGVSPGAYSINACQAGVGCAQAGFEVLAIPNDSTTTLPDTTTTAPTTTTSTVATTTSTRPAATTTAPRSSTTTRPAGTTSTSSGSTTTTTVPAGPSTSTTGTTEAPVMPTDTTTPLAEAGAPTGFDLEALIDEMFSPKPLVTEEPAPPPEESLEAIPPALPEDDGEIVESIEDLTVAMPRLPQAGLWIGWAIAIISAAALILTVDEIRRRRSK